MKFHSITRGITAVATALAVTLSTIPTSHASLAGARASARDLFDSLDYLGLNVRDTYSSGLLRRGQSIVIRTTLYAGNDYYLVAGGCEDARDVDIAVFDQNGNLIDEDDDIESVALAKVTPRWTGTFLIKITMYDSTPDGAHWVLQYGYL